MGDGLDSAWDAVYAALTARWHVGPVTFDPGCHAFSVTARGGRTQAPLRRSVKGANRSARRPGGARRPMAPRTRSQPQDGVDMGRLDKRVVA